MKAIGIVGGVGPFAGTDLADKVFKHTKARTDQEHIDLYLVSCPSIIPDRTGFLLEGGDDPAPGIQRCIEKLALCGASAVGVSCNTAHSPDIIGRVRIPEGVTLVNMIEKTAEHVKRDFGDAKVGLLSTLGTQDTGVYDKYFDNLVKPDSCVAGEVHQAIYDKTYGIKAVTPVSSKATVSIYEAVLHLKSKGCKAVILGCTELPLVFPGKDEFEGVKLIDPTEILAIELIRSTCPEKLI